MCVFWGRKEISQSKQKKKQTKTTVNLFFYQRTPDAQNTHRLVDERVTGVGAVKGFVGAASAAAMQRHAAGEVELAGGFRVLFGHLHAHLPGLAGGALDLLQDD